MISRSMRTAALGAFQENKDPGELFDMGVASGQLDVMYAVRALGTNPSAEALETVFASFGRKITDLATGYLVAELVKEDKSK